MNRAEPLTDRERELIEEAYRELLPVFLGTNPDTGERDRERAPFSDEKIARLDLHSIFVEALVSAVRAWTRAEHDGSPIGYAYNAARLQLQNAAGRRKERDKHEQSFDAPPVTRQLVRGIRDGGGNQVFEYVPARALPKQLSTAPVLPAELNGAPIEPDYGEALAGLIVGALADRAITQRQAEALYRRTDLRGDGGAAGTYEDLGEALGGINRSAARKLEQRAIEGLREYVAERGLSWPE